jgi:RHS repeat-associated protein
MPGRNYNSNTYRYGFNGKENDDEVKGSDNSYDFGARIYDSRIGRWLSLDPLQSKYPALSPYHSFANSPILVVDKDGKENIVYLAISPDAYAALGVVRAGVMMAAAQKSLDNIMGEGVVKVQFAPEGFDKFDINNLDKSDAVVAVGSASEVMEFSNRNLGKDHSIIVGKSDVR